MQQIKNLFLLLALAAIPLSAVAAGPDPDSIYIQSITYGGSGSPQGTVGTSISDDRTTFTLIFDSFIASHGPGVPLTESRKNSQINLNLHGEGHARLTTDIRGYIQIPAGSKATVTLVAVDSKGHAKTFKQTFVGPIAKDYLLTASVKTKSKTLVSPETLQVQVAVDGPAGASAQATVDSIDGKLTKNDNDDDDDDDRDND